MPCSMTTPLLERTSLISRTPPSLCSHLPSSPSDPRGLLLSTGHPGSGVSSSPSGTTAEQFQDPSQDKRVCVQTIPQLTSQPKTALTQDAQLSGHLHPRVPGPGTVCPAEAQHSFSVLSAPALSTIQTPPWQKPNCPRHPFPRDRAAPDQRDAALSRFLGLVFPVYAPQGLSSSSPGLPARATVLL